MAKSESNKPVKRFRLGYVECSVWQNDGYYSVTMSKSYKDGDEYKNTGSFGAGDIENARRVLRQASDWISAQ